MSNKMEAHEMREASWSAAALCRFRLVVGVTGILIHTHFIGAI
jgi:hypothetical protein